MIQLHAKKLDHNAILPKKTRAADAAFDMYANEDKVIPAKERVTIKTGIAMSFPKGYVFFIKDRSGLAAKEGITTMAGVIDPEYRGEYLIILYNTTEKEYEVHKGDRIAQGVLLPVPESTIIEVDSLEETERGEKGIGSTGK